MGLVWRILHQFGAYPTDWVTDPPPTAAHSCWETASLPSCGKLHLGHSLHINHNSIKCQSVNSLSFPIFPLPFSLNSLYSMWKKKNIQSLFSNTRHMCARSRSEKLP